MSVVSNNILAGASGQGGAGDFAIERSLRFNPGDSAYLNRTPSSSGNLKTWTWSGWVKRSNSGAGHTNDFFSCGVNIHNGGAGGAQANAYFDVDGTIQVYEYSGGYGYNYRTTQVFRDFSAWYHIVISLDTTDSTAGDRVKIYINGDRVTSFSTSNAPTLNFEGEINKSGVQHYISDTAAPFNGYLADVHFIDGQALAATDFGETDEFGVWQPKQFAGSYTVAASGTTTSLSQVGWASSDQANIWDGNTSTRAVGYVNNSVGTISFNPPLTNVTKVETYTQNYNHFLNGASVSGSGSSNPGWFTLYDNSSSPITLNSLGNSYDSNQTVDFYAIRINGTIVNAQTWTPPSGVGLGDGGANSFYLKFADNSSNAALGYDAAGSNNWTVNNLTANELAAPSATVTGDPSSSTDSPFSSGYSVDFDGNDSIKFTGPGTVTGDLTVECFYKMNSSSSGYERIFSTNEGSYSSEQTMIRRHTGGNIQFYLGNGTPEQQGGAISVDTWYHAAMVYDRSANTVSYYIDGSRIGTDSYSSDVPITEMVAGLGYGSENFHGKISNCRVTKQALYSGTSFTVPTSTLTTTSQGATGSNVVLLCCHQNSTTAVEGAISVPTSIDSLVDTPTNGTQTDTGAGGEVVGSYASWNPLVPSSSTFSNGNLQVTTSGGSGYPLDMANFYTPAGTGKWYWEFELSALSGSNYTMVGMLPRDSGYQQGASDIPQAHGGISVYVGYDGSVTAASGSATTGTATATFAVGDILGWAFDAENGTLQCYKNGVSQGTQFTNIRTDIGWVFCVTDYDNSATATYVINFGQRAFAYTAPSGFKALCTANLPEPTIADGSQYFDTKLYDGNGGTNAITMPNSNLSPDFVWLKARSAAYGHGLYDSIRGALNTLNSNGNFAAYDEANSLTSFDSNGFTLGSSAAINQSGQTFASWNWDAGSSNTTIAASSLNSSLYDQSQTWSTYGTFTGTVHNDYDWSGVFSASDWYGADGSMYLSSGTGKWTLTSSIACSSGVKFYVWGNLSITINEGLSDEITQTSTGGNAFHYFTIPFSGNIASIKVNTATVYLLRIFVDGAALIDAGITLGSGDVPNVPSIASTVRSSPESGFSIVTYSAASNPLIAHGLNAVPEFVIVKVLNANSHWTIFHKDLGVNKELRFTTDAASTVSGIWGTDSMWTSSTFGVYQTINQLDNNYGNMVAYCFNSVEGYSSVGSYIGNGNASGPFIWTGFRPAFIIGKRTDGGSDNWFMNDSSRLGYNDENLRLYPNLTNGEGASSDVNMDILSNGFKLISTNSNSNGSGATYIYYAVAEHPFKTARAR